MRPADVTLQPALSHGRRFRKIPDDILHYQPGAVYSKLGIQTVGQHITGEIVHFRIPEIVPVGKLLPFL